MAGRRGNRNVRQRGGGRNQAVEEPQVLAAETFEVRAPERDMFNSLNARTVVRPSVVNWDEWLQMRDNNDVYAAYFVDNIRLLGLESIARVNERISKQLLLEFYLTFTWTSWHSFSVRLNGIERQVSSELCEQIFGFRCQRDHSNPTDEDYHERTFWDAIRTDADWNERIQFALTYVESNNLYMVYRFFARCVLNKDEPSRMNHEELYLMWCMLNKPAKAEIFPHIWDVIRRRQSITATVRPNPLCLGSFVTILARHFQWVGPPLDDFTRTTQLVFNTRELHVGGDPVPWVVYVMAEPRTRAPNRRQTPRARPAEPEANDGEGNDGEGGGAREVYVPGSGFMPDFGGNFGSGPNFETGSSSRSRAYTLEDIWEAHESTRTELITVRDELRGTRAELAAYRGEVSNYHADIDRYQENVLSYREAVEANTVAFTEYRAAVEANTLAIRDYRSDVEARGTAHDEMFRVMMERLNLNGPPPPPPNPMD